MNRKRKLLLCILTAAVMSFTACESVDEGELFQTSEETEDASSGELSDMLSGDDDTSSEPGIIMPDQESSAEELPDGGVSVTEADEFLMPDLIGMTWDEANEKYSRYMTLIPQQEWSDAAKDQIFEQEYPEGRKIKTGTEVKVKVSMGIRQVEIQDVSFLSASAAENKLIKDGFKVKKTYIESDEVQKDYVIRTEPPAHELADQGSTVVLLVSLGSEDSEVYVPDFVKLPLNVALERAEEYSLVAEVEYEDNDKYEKDTVIRQSIEPGNVVDRDTRIILTVSSGKIGEITKKLTFTLPKKATGEFEFRYFVNGILDPDSSVTLDVGLASSKTMKYEVTGMPGETKLVTVKVTSLETGLSGIYMNITVTFPEDGGRPTVEDEVNSKIFEELS